MNVIVGKIEIIIHKDFVTHQESIEINTDGSDEDIAFGFAEAMKTNSRIKSIFNKAVKKANSDRAKNEN